MHLCFGGLFFDPAQEEFAKLLQTRLRGVMCCENFDCYVICVQVLYVVYYLAQYSLLIVPVEVVALNEKPSSSVIRGSLCEGWFVVFLYMCVSS